MKKIFKYTLNYTNFPEVVRLPKGAEVVDFGIQNKTVQLWALVNPDEKEEKRVFVLAFTGQELEWEILKTYGSRIVEETGIVIHLLELVPSTKATDPTEDERLTEKVN